MQQLQFEAIGTHWELWFNHAIDAPRLAALSKMIEKRTAAFDKAYSRFRSDSLVAAISKKAGTYALPPDGFAMLEFYKQLYDATNGLVTPLIGRLMADAGYDATYSFRRKALTRPPKWEDVIAYDKQHITVRRPVLLDFGAAGKGYLVDIIGELLQQQGTDAFVINASGDILHRSPSVEMLQVGLENPADVTEVIGVAELGNKSICASSGSKRKWQDMHHIINPATLQPVQDIIATWVIARDTMTADGLATALFFAPPARLLKRFAFSYALLNKDMSLTYSKDFPVKVFEAADA